MEQKKLLILGGISHMIDVVAKAKEMGIYTIVCDYSPSSPAKLIADASYDVSTTDIDLLCDIAHKENIDGVFAGFEDLNTWNALKVCQRLGLPFYATEEQLSLTSNKYNFKKFCRESNVPVVPEFTIESEKDLCNITAEDFPLIVKPVDSYASRGITVVYNIEELEDAYEKAKQYSKTKTFIVERFFDGYGVELYYTVVNGTPYLSAMTDRYVIHQGNGVPPLPTATVFPSKHLDTCFEKYDAKIKAMIKKMGIENGLLLFQSVKDNDNLYIYEMAFRLTGEKHYQIVKKETGLDLMEFMIKLAIGQDVSGYKPTLFDKDCLPKPACNLAILIGKGKINNIIGVEEITSYPEVIDYVQTLYVGDEVVSIGNYGQIFIRLNIVADTNQRLLQVLNDVETKVKVLSDLGKDLIISHFLKDEKNNQIFKSNI